MYLFAFNPFTLTINTPTLSLFTQLKTIVIGVSTYILTMQVCVYMCLFILQIYEDSKDHNVSEFFETNFAECFYIPPFYLQTVVETYTFKVCMYIQCIHCVIQQKVGRKTYCVL